MHGAIFIYCFSFGGTYSLQKMVRHIVFMLIKGTDLGEIFVYNEQHQLVSKFLCVFQCSTIGSGCRKHWVQMKITII